MITNFEEITQELSDEELKIIPILIKGFEGHGQENPIKAPDIVKRLNVYLERENFTIRMTEPRLRKYVNYIRSKSLQPLIATSNGYFVSVDHDVIASQVKSLRERANSIYNCATGLLRFIQ